MYDGTVSYTRLSILPAMMIQSFSVKPSTSRSARSNLSTKQTTARPPLTLAPLSKSPLSRLFESYRTVSADAPLINPAKATNNCVVDVEPLTRLKFVPRENHPKASPSLTQTEEERARLLKISAPPSNFPIFEPRRF